jgi:hypothetical protein
MNGENQRNIENNEMKKLSANVVSSAAGNERQQKAGVMALNIYQSIIMKINVCLKLKLCRISITSEKVF